MADPTLRVLVIGTGSIGTRHLGVFSSIGGLDVTGAPVREDADARAVELRQRGFGAVTTVAAGLDRRPQVVVVASETARHLDHVRSSLNVPSLRCLLVEKPLAPTSEGVPEVLTAARERGVRVFTGFNLRFHPAVRLARRWLPRIGAPHAAWFRCHSFLPAWHPGRDHRDSYSASESQGGVLRDMAHDIDLATWLIGRPRRIWARLRTTGRLGIAAEEAAEVHFEVGDCAVQIAVDYLSRPTTRGFGIHGEEGTLTIDLVSGEVSIAGPCGEERAGSPTASVADTYAIQARRVIEIARGDGAAAELATGDDGAFCAAFVDAARASNRTGRAAAILPAGHPRDEGRADGARNE